MATNEELDLESFGEVMDDFLRDNTIQMLLTMPEGTLDVQVQDNTGFGSAVVRFYILLNALSAVGDAMREALKLHRKSPEWAQAVDGLLGLVKAELLGGETDDGE